jgi:hypothetical protein
MCDSQVGATGHGGASARTYAGPSPLSCFRSGRVAPWVVDDPQRGASQSSPPSLGYFGFTSPTMCPHVADAAVSIATR